MNDQRRRATIALELGHVYGVTWAELCDWIDMEGLTTRQRVQAERLAEAFTAAGTPDVGDESVCEALRAIDRREREEAAGGEQVRAGSHPQLDLEGGAHEPQQPAAEIWLPTHAQSRLFEPQMEGQVAFDV